MPFIFIRNFIRIFGLLSLSLFISQQAFSQMRAGDIIEAAMLGKIKQISAFIDAGVDINQENEDGENALTTAIGFRRVKVVEWLLSQGAKWPNNSEDVFYEPLWRIVNPINRPLLELMLKNGYDINLKTKGGDSVLHLVLSSFEYSHPKVIKDVEYLIGIGADVNSKDTSGASVIWAVCQYDGETADFKAVIDLLLSKGAEINAEDHDGDNLLALNGCQEPVIKDYLISKGATDFY